MWSCLEDTSVALFVCYLLIIFFYVSQCLCLLKISSVTKASTVSGYSAPEVTKLFETPSKNNESSWRNVFISMSSWGKNLYLWDARGIELCFQSLRQYCFKKPFCRHSAFRFFLWFWKKVKFMHKLASRLSFKLCDLDLPVKAVAGEHLAFIRKISKSKQFYYAKLYSWKVKHAVFFHFDEPAYLMDVPSNVS